ncbi:MAG: type IX secretion system membrane protein PorP/SprF [Flavobacteriales bacterium]|nr:type IX secretion system membrane protein PorP/SprF [Flavobacteriales bacterium]
MRHSILLLSLALSLAAHAQHTPITSQYLFNGLLINPAYAGSRDAFAANLTYRHQWVGMEGAPVTQVLSVHSPLKGRKLGLGAVLYSDRIGVSRETGLTTNYSYRVKFRKGRLSFGLGAGAIFAQARWTEVALQDRQDAVYAADTRGSFRPTFSGGVFYYKKTFFMGASVPFLLGRRFDAANGRWVASADLRQLQPMITGGYVWKVSDDFKLKPSTLIRYQSSSNVQADLNMNVFFKDRFTAGLSYRTQDALVGMFEVMPTQQWRIGYSYDLGLSAITPYHSGTHELMLQYELGYRIRVKDPRYF